MENEKLPQGWIKVFFKEVADATDFVANGSFESVKNSVKYSNIEKYAIIVRLKDYTSNWKGDFRYITKDSYDFLSKSSLVPGDLFLTNVGAPGKLFLVPELGMPMTIGPNGLRIRAKNISSNRFLAYYYASDIGKKQINDIVSGTAQQKFNKTGLRLSTVLIAPLDEQNRIVEKLDKLFVSLEILKTKLDAIPKLLKNFRQAVLSQAVTGKLTEEWRKGKSLEEWKKIHLEEIIKSGPQNGLYMPQSSYGDGSLIVRIDNFYDGVINPWKTLKRLKLTSKDIELYSLGNGDILINRVNSMSHLGKSGLVDELTETCVFESNIMRLRLEDTVALPSFVIKFLSSHVGYSQLRKNAKQAVNQASINQTDVKLVEMMLPALLEQQEIVLRVESLFANSDDIEKQYITLKTQIDKLPQAILAKAFKGELVSQDPNDEPASELLDRIKEIQSLNKKAEKLTQVVA